MIEVSLSGALLLVQHCNIAPIQIAVTGVEPAVKYSFCLGTQTRLRGQYKAELTLSPRLHVKLLITAIRAIGRFRRSLQTRLGFRTNWPSVVWAEGSEPIGIWWGMGAPRCACFGQQTLFSLAIGPLLLAECSFPSFLAGRWTNHGVASFLLKQIFPTLITKISSLKHLKWHDVSWHCSQ